MMGASIYVMPFMIHRSVPGIGPYVLPSFPSCSFACHFSSICYSILALPIAQGWVEVIYTQAEGFIPFSDLWPVFSQWFGLSIVIGVISYIIVPFIRDIAFALDWKEVASLLEIGCTVNHCEYIICGHLFLLIFLELIFMSVR
jgi:APA family basic amino acid/polyamine antiporter